MAVETKAKAFHFSHGFFEEIERRAHAYPTPPKELDLLQAPDAQLAKYGLPPRPDKAKEPELYQLWNKLLGQPFDAFAIDFANLEHNLKPPIPLNRVGCGVRRGIHPVENSRNWSGAYIIPESSDKFVYVTGSWQVPSPSLPPVYPAGAGAGDEYQVSVWIGIDGHQRYPMSSMPQIGTTSAYAGSDGTVTTSAWWQWWSLDASYPPSNRNNPPVPIPDFPVSVGDEIIAILTLMSADEVQFFIKNQMTGLFPTFLVVAPGPILPLGCTAEWIVGDRRSSIVVAFFLCRTTPTLIFTIASRRWLPRSGRRH